MNGILKILIDSVIWKASESGQLTFRYCWHTDWRGGQEANWWPLSDFGNTGRVRGLIQGDQPHVPKEARFLMQCCADSVFSRELYDSTFSLETHLWSEWVNVLRAWWEEKSMPHRGVWLLPGTSILVGYFKNERRHESEHCHRKQC